MSNPYHAVPDVHLTREPLGGYVMIGRTIKQYRIVEKLGKGGMGDVYLAQDTRLDRQVAVKFLPFYTAEASADQKRFLREAKAAARLNHPNIAQVHGFEEEEGRLFIVMEHIAGSSLKEILEEEHPRPLKEILSWIRQAAEALSKAHEAGVMHRDIKPDNILVTTEGAVKIVDFGLAKLAGQSDLTTTDSTLGTAAYMSPEQAQGDAVDHRTDIWSLGVVLYEMVTGTRPYRGEHLYAIVYSILSSKPKPIDQLRSDLPAGLGVVIERALSKDPDRRYQRMGEMLADLRLLEEGVELATGVTASVATSRPPSIVVLPFANISADKQQEYFCDGMAEEIINALSKVEGLRVVARTSAFSFKGKDEDVREIGRKLNVSSVMEGSVQKADDRVRISVQLTNAADGYHVWSERYDRKLEDIFAIQDEISLAVVENLKVQLLGEEEAKLTKRYTEDLDAFNAYLKGLYFWGTRTAEGLQEAIDCFERAIAMDQQYAAAHAGIADVYNSMGYWGFLSPKEAFPHAKAAGKRALEIDDRLAEAHGALAWINTVFDWDWEASESRFKWAIELNPNCPRTRNWYAVHLMFRGRFDEAIEEIDRALELDPLALLINANAGAIRYCARRYDEAEALYNKTLEMEPNFGVAHLFLGCLHIQKGRYQEAISELQNATKLTGGIPWAIGCLGIALAKSGKRKKAEELLGDLEVRAGKKYISPVGAALVYLGLGEVDKFREWAEEALEYRDVTMPHLKVFPEFDSVRSEPWFQAILKRMRLSD